MISLFMTMTDNSPLVIVECKVSRKESEDFSSPPLAGRPNNFGMVIPGVYRSSYPKAQDFEYLRGLKLKTLVYVPLVEREQRLS